MSLEMFAIQMILDAWDMRNVPLFLLGCDIVSDAFGIPT